MNGVAKHRLAIRCCGAIEAPPTAIASSFYDQVEQLAGERGDDMATEEPAPVHRPHKRRVSVAFVLTMGKCLPSSL